MTTNTFIWLACTLAVVAMVAFVVGRRGRRIDDHARCRRCAFDLSGHAPRQDRCPECGRGLRGRRAVRIGRRRGRPWALVVSGVTLVLAGTCAIIPLRGLDPNTFKPSWLLLREAAGEDAILTTGALDELVTRLADGSFADRGAMRTVVAETVRRLGDAQRPWEPRWAELTEAAILRGLVTPEDLEAYARAVVTRLPQSEVARAIRPGAAAPFRTGVVQTRGPRTTSILDVEIVWEDALIDGRRGLLPEMYGYGQTVGADHVEPQRFAALNMGTRISGLPAEPGTVTLALSGSLHVAVRVAIPGPPNVALPPAETWAVFRAAERRHATNALVRIPLHHTTEVRVVAVGEPLLPERETTARWDRVEETLAVAQAVAGSGRLVIGLNGSADASTPLGLQATLVHDGGRIELRGTVTNTLGGALIGAFDGEIVGQPMLEVRPDVRVWERAPGVEAIPTRPIRMPLTLDALERLRSTQAPVPIPAAPAAPRNAGPVERPLADAPVAELVAGFTGSTLTPHHAEFIRRLREEPPPTDADVALAFPALLREARGAGRTHHPACAVLERLVRQKRLAPEHYAALLDVMLDAVSVRARARVRGGAPIPFLVEHGNLIPIRGSGGPAFFVELLPRDAAAAAGAPAMRIDGYVRQVMGRSSITAPTVLGPHRLLLDYDARLHLSYDARGEALAERLVVFTTNCEIVEDSLRPVDVVVDIDPRVVVEFAAPEDGAPWATAHVRLRWDAMPVDLCVRVEIILDGAPADGRAPMVLFEGAAAFAMRSRSVVVPPRADWPDTARIVLHPDPEAAEGTLDTFRVLGRPLVFDDVPVHLVPKAR